MTASIRDENEVLRFCPDETDSGKRLDVYLSGQIEDLSRTRIQSLIEEGNIRSDAGLLRKCKTKVGRSKWIEVTLPPPLESAIAPEDLPIRVLYEDRDIAVVEKPPGIPTHPTTTKTSGTLVNGLLYHLSDLSEIGGVLRPGIVHRLDRVTSGLLAIAKNSKAHQDLSNQFRERTVKKTYRALCLGSDPGSEGTVEGRIDRHPHHRRRMVLGEKGRESVSTFRRVCSESHLRGLLVQPHTGRTHQIRVHLEKLHCPVVLDEIYGYEPRRWPYSRLNPVLKTYPGILLHAEKIEFKHPATGAPVRFQTPPPDDFVKVWGEVFGVGGGNEGLETRCC